MLNISSEIRSDQRNGKRFFKSTTRMVKAQRRVNRNAMTDAPIISSPAISTGLTCS